MILAKSILAVFRLSSLSLSLGIAALFSISLISSRGAEPAPATDASKPISRWIPSQTHAFGDAKPVVLGAPSQVGAALEFDGEHDALLFSANPLQGLGQFTIQVLIRPAADGAPEQRFFHLQDNLSHRVLMELRLDAQARSWALDTYLHASAENHLTLLERGKKHPVGQWTWVTLTYDGKTMVHYVAGVKEAEGPVAFPAMSAGEASLGVRLNRVNWFKGGIQEIRIYDHALNPEAIAAQPPRAVSAFATFGCNGRRS